jgi:hypothetical protein
LQQANFMSEFVSVHQALNVMIDFSSDSENLQGPTSSNQRGERWRGRLKLLARVVLWLLSPLLGRVPEDDYGAKDLDGGGFQTLFGSDNGKKRRWWGSN